MKKLLTIAALAGVASLTYGQGYVGVANTSTTKVSAGGAATASSATGASYYFEVLIAPTTTTTINPDNPLSGGWSDSTTMMINAGSGRIVGTNNNYDAAGGGAQIPSGFATSGTADFAVIGWASNLGPTLADALAWWNNGALNGPDSALTPGATSTYFGVSAVALNIPGAPAGGPYNSIWGTAASGAIPGMNIALPKPIRTAAGCPNITCGRPRNRRL